MKGVDIDAVRSILMSMPGVEEGTMHGQRSFKMRGKLLACPAIHKSAEPNSLLVKMPANERDQLLADEPHIYYVTDHYFRSTVVLVRLSEIDRKSLRSLLERACGLMKPGRRTAGTSLRKPALALNAVPKKDPAKHSSGLPRQRAPR